MNRIIFLTIASLMVLGLVLLRWAAPTTTPPTTPTQPVITLKAATYFPPMSAQSKMMEAFLAAVTNASGGAVNFTYYPGGTLLGGSQLYDGAATGMVDIIMTGLHYTPGRFPPMDALYQPTGIPSPWVATHVANDYYQKYKFGEFNDTHPLFFHASAPLVMYTKQPVRTLADLSGKTLRCGDPNNPVLTALGAMPNNMAMGDVHEAISKDLIDGCMIGADGFGPWKLADVVDYTTFPYVAGCDVFVATMSNKCWNNLTSDLQKVFTDVSASYIDEACMMWTEVNEESCEVGLNASVEFITLNATERAQWQTALEGCIPAWVTKMVDDKGYLQSEVEGWLDYIRGRIAYWIDEQIDQGIPFLVGYPPS